MFSNKEKIKKIIIGVLLIISLFFLYKIYHVLAPFVLSAVFIYILAPLVNYVSEIKIGEKKIPRGISVILIYLIFFSSLTLIFFTIGPRLYSETLKIASDIPGQIESFRNEVLPRSLINIQEQFNKYDIPVDINEEFTKLIDNLLSSGLTLIEQLPLLAKTLVSGFLHTLTSFIVVFIVTAFILTDLPKIKSGLKSILSKEVREWVTDLAGAINKDLNGVIRGQLLICLLNGVLTTIGLLILNVKYAVTIGIIAGVFSLIPIFGTIFSTVPAVLVGITQSWLVVLQIIILIAVIHLIEANLLNPKIMGDSVELHPAIVIFSIFVGEHLFGIAGLLLGVPFAAIVRSILKYIYNRFFLEKDLLKEFEQQS